MADLRLEELKIIIAMLVMIFAKNIDTSSKTKKVLPVIIILIITVWMVEKAAQEDRTTV